MQEIGKRRLKVNEDRVKGLFLVMNAFTVWNYVGTQIKPFRISQEEKKNLYNVRVFIGNVQRKYNFT